MTGAVEWLAGFEKHMPDSSLLEITPQILLRAYCNGIFPMSNAADDPKIFWVEPQMRGILPLNAFHVPRSLAKTYRRQPYHLRINTDFRGVIDGCAAISNTRKSTWINPVIRNLFCELHSMGYAHSVEAWREDNLVGGLYGLAIGGAFFGESMFTRSRDASKLCLVHLVNILNQQGFCLLDTQFTNTHLEQFGIQEVPKAHYLALLDKALDINPAFQDIDPD